MIHQYKLSGYNIVLDVYSGSVHAVDDVAYDAIALIDQGSSREQAAAALAKKYAGRADVTESDINDVLDDIDELTAAGQLFAPDAYADHAFDFKNRSNVVKALCLHVAHTCNLNCSYCFAAQGKFHGEAGLMSFETGKRALDFLVEHSGTRRNLDNRDFSGVVFVISEKSEPVICLLEGVYGRYVLIPMINLLSIVYCHGFCPYALQSYNPWKISISALSSVSFTIAFLVLAVFPKL